jgi:hypothetical protein
MNMRNWRYFIVASVVFIISSQTASAGKAAYELHWKYEGDGIFLMYDNSTLSGNTSSSWRSYIDDEYGNGDGIVTSDEADVLISYLLNEWDWPYTTKYFILDVYRAQGELLSAAFDNITGPVNSTQSTTLTTCSRFVFIYDQNITTHTFHYAYATESPDAAYVNLSFEVPEGWEITDVRWLEQVSLSQDSRRVEGQVPWDQQIDITFKEINAPDMTIHYLVALAIVVALCFAGGYILKRRGKRMRESTNDQKVEDDAE